MEFDVDSSGRLSNESLETLTTDLIQVFNFQYNNKDHERLDIKFIYMHPTLGETILYSARGIRKLTNFLVKSHL